MPYQFQEPTPEKLAEFWLRDDNADLLTSIFPTRRYGPSIGPCYPGGRFSADHHKLTSVGFSVLSTTCDGRTRTMRVDGLTHRHPGEDPTISEICGACIKPINGSVIIIDFDLPIAMLSGVDDADKLIEFIESSNDRAYGVRGNRKRLTLVFRQDPLFRGAMEELLGSLRKMIFVSNHDKDWKIEISTTSGHQGNLYGLHKSGRNYLNSFPEVISVLTVDEFNAFVEIANQAGFNTKSATDHILSNGRISNDDVLADNASSIIDANRYMRVIRAYEPEFKISVLDLIPSTTKGLIGGNIAYNNSDKWYVNTSGKHEPGNRRDALWQVVSDLSAFRNILVTLGYLSSNDDICDQLINIVAHRFVPEENEIVSAYLDGRTQMVYKWSPDYVLSQWESARDNERFHSMRQEYAPVVVSMMVKQIITKLSEIAANRRSDSELV